MVYKATNKLEVWRKLADGSTIMVGELAQNKRGVYFKYQAEYLQKHHSLSPFNLSFDNSLQLAPNQPHNALHGAFSDSLPDGWGLLLMDRIFRQADILPNQITAMDRLAFVGDRAMGALFYRPASSLQATEQAEIFSIVELGSQAQAIFDGQTTQVLQALVNAGSSGGARPKAQLYLNQATPNLCSITPKLGSAAYLVKFTSQQLSLGHEEGLCEAAYLSMALQAGIEVPQWLLLDAPNTRGHAINAENKWLALKRFDTTVAPGQTEGRLHLHSASGLLDADYRMPSLDYADLIKASSLLCKSPAVGQAVFRRMIFNLFALNQDDHSKNWAFLQGDDGQWQLAPFYDVTFSPSAYDEHATAFAGFGKKPTLKVLQKLAMQANFSSWKQAQRVIAETVEAIQSFNSISQQLNVKGTTRNLISKQLARIYQDNKILLQE
ncbi:MAG: type II toxin-antitoxin system HipA family toxin [Oceanospirillaceae bacterium]|nr:type II toxin-antitoxin system HipA family toxin [Oceanospirillaceae bacterium]